jgi:hypothetical protein
VPSYFENFKDYSFQILKNFEGKKLKFQEYSISQIFKFQISINYSINMCLRFQGTMVSPKKAKKKEEAPDHFLCEHNNNNNNNNSEVSLYLGYLLHM